MARRSSSTAEVQKVWLCVLKTSDLVGPRRHPERPRVVVKTLAKRPGLELDRWVKLSPRARRMQVVNVVYEAMPGPTQPGGRDAPLLRPTQREAIKTAEKALRQRLQCDGYTVNGDLTVWHLYVIELTPPGGQAPQPAATGYLYVGQTSQPLEDRIRQHREGHYNVRGHRLHSQTCHRRFVQPRFDLVPEDFTQTFFCQQDALTAEADLRIALESAGYVVEGGTEQLAQRRQDLGLAE
jgi:predicted GIY-YIG superfamily endonuclease